MDIFFSPQQDVFTPLTAFGLLFALLICHAIADFSLQGDYMARFKNRHHTATDTTGKPTVIWPYVMSAHCLIHAGFVWIVTGSLALAVLEFICHWVIDFAKCERWTGYHLDQLLHFVSKLLLIALFFTMGPILF